MRLIIGTNIEIELLEGTTLELSDKNMLFGFDDIQCQRTTNIKIPATPANVRHLWVANDWHTHGQYCRQRLSAHIVEGLVQIDGYLYIAEYDRASRTFSACFVGGELTDFITMRDADTIDKYLQSDFQYALTLTDTSHSVDADDEAQVSAFPYINVKRQDHLVPQKPSWRINDLITAAAHHFGVSADLISGENSRARLEPSDAQKVPAYSAAIVESGTDILDQMTDFGAMAENGTQILIRQDRYLNYKLSIAPEQTYAIQCYRARTPVSVTIAPNAPFVAGHSYAFGVGHSSSSVSGKYQADIIYDNITRGGTYEFDTGDVFILIDKYYYHYDSNERGYGIDAFRLNIPVTIESTESRDLTFGDAVRAMDNIPQVTFIDMLKMGAALSGGLLLYDKANGFSFVSDFSGGNTFEIKDVLRVGTLTRSVSGYAQHNFVRFNHDGVRERDHIVIDYQMPNDNAERENELQTIDASEGNEAYNEVVATETNGLRIYRANQSGGGRYCRRTTLSLNAAMIALLAGATEMDIEAPMTLLEYTTLQPLTRIICLTTTWLWHEKRWKDGICTLKLVKI